MSSKNNKLGMTNTFYNYNQNGNANTNNKYMKTLSTGETHVEVMRNTASYNFFKKQNEQIKKSSKLIENNEENQQKNHSNIFGINFAECKCIQSSSIQNKKYLGGQSRTSDQQKQQPTRLLLIFDYAYNLQM